MRLIDVDAFREDYALAERCEDCRRYVKKDCGYPCYSARDFCGWLDDAPTIGGWISADKRPPKQGRYLVWGLTRITPDHYDEANGFWEIQPAFWFEKSGWDRKVKFWQMLPEPPKEVTGDEG